MKKELIVWIVKDDLEIYPNEKNRIEPLQNYLHSQEENKICDWNNVNGHLTAGGFIYSKTSKQFLVLWHKDLQMFLYPGGHCESSHDSPLDTAKSEVVEETGIKDFKPISLNDKKLIPFDIDIHKIPYNFRINMPEHNHFDFRYLFVVDDVGDVVIDKNESSSYKWINCEELKQDVNYGNILKKIEKYL